MKQETILIKILPGEGGQDSWLFANDLADVYVKYSSSKDFVSKLVKETKKEICIEVKGKDVFKAFSKESGIHRVQRIPPTESKGRVHTSIINVVVLNGAINNNCATKTNLFGAINKSDVKITYYKDSGAGGQHRNKTMSGVRLQYKGELIECCEGRSQTKNKELAFKRLEEKLEEKQKNKNNKKISKEFNKQNKNKGKRGDYNRNYNYQRNEVVQDGKTYELKKILKGKLNLIYN